MRRFHNNKNEIKFLLIEREKVKEFDKDKGRAVSKINTITRTEAFESFQRYVIINC